MLDMFSINLKYEKQYLISILNLSFYDWDFYSYLNKLQP